MTTASPSTPREINAAPAPNGVANIHVVDVDALLKIFNRKEFDAVKGFVNELDDKERGAAKYFNDLEKQRRYVEKAAERNRRRVWDLRTKPRVLNSDDSVREAVDAEVGLPTLPQCYEEIKKLLVIERHPIYAKALEEWSRKEKLFTSRVDRKQKAMADLKNEIYHLIGFFSVFQGVLLTAVAQSSLLHCNNWWSPILLSLVASVVTIAAVVQKLIKVHEFESTIHSERQSLKVVVARLHNLRDKGVDNFEFAKFSNKEAEKRSTLWSWA